MPWQGTKRCQACFRGIRSFRSKSMVDFRWNTLYIHRSQEALGMCAVVTLQQIIKSQIKEFLKAHMTTAHHQPYPLVVCRSRCSLPACLTRTLIFRWTANWVFLVRVPTCKLEQLPLAPILLCRPMSAYWMWARRNNCRETGDFTFAKQFIREVAEENISGGLWVHWNDRSCAYICVHYIYIL